MCRFSDAGNDETLDALGRPASEKRHGTKQTVDNFASFSWWPLLPSGRDQVWSGAAPVGYLTEVSTWLD
jgi:hypothetical protein